MSDDGVEDTLSLEELSKYLGDAENITAEEIEESADEIKIGRPWEGDILDPDE